MERHYSPSPVYRIVFALGALLHLGAGPNQYTPPSSEPRHLHVFGHHLYFSANDGMHGRELWRVDEAGKAELMLDITPGAVEVDIDYFHEFQGHLYFRVAERKDGGDLWRTDGTPAGTTLVRAFEPNEQGICGILTASAEHLYFAVGEAWGSSKLWVTDGSTEKTVPVMPRNVDDVPILTAYSGLVLGDVHFFGASNHAIAGLWRADGFSGTMEQVFPMSEIPDYLFALDERRFLFGGGDEAHGRELWISEGTPESTRRLKDIYPGPETSAPREFALIASDDGHPLAVFAATTPQEGRELWQTDGTPEGTRLRADLFPGTGSSSPSPSDKMGAEHFLLAIGEGAGKELWRYHAETGTYSITREIVPGPGGSDLYQLCRVGSRLYFSALTEEHGEELWVVKPVDGIPRLHSDIYPGPEGACPYYSVDFRGRLVTAATSDALGRELWIEDPTKDEMVLFADINSDSSVNPSSFPENLTAAGPWLFFSANDIKHGTELWRTDGTEEGTNLVKDIYSGTASSAPTELIAVGSTLYFSAEDGVHGAELWRSDGTTAGTSMVHDIHPDGAANPRHLTVFKNLLGFSAYHPGFGEEPWILEPGNRPRLLRNIRAGVDSSAPSDFFAWKDHLYFQADDGVRGRELWRTDGTEAGTVLVRDIITAPFETLSLHSPRAHGGVLYFVSDLDGRGRELWKLDESRNRIQLVRDIVDGNAYDVVHRIDR